MCKLMNVMKKIKYIAALVLFLLYGQTFAQHKVQVLAKVSQDGTKIKLRWAPTSPILWKLANKQTTGYEIKKFKVAVNGQVLNKPVLVTAFTRVVKVPDFTLDYTPIRTVWFQKFMAASVLTQPRTYFESTTNVSNPALIINDTYAILWGSIYGSSESYLPSTSTENGIIDISSELEKRFNASLSICDYDFEAAVFVGLGLEDATAVVGEKYLYEVTALNTGISPVPTKGTAYIGLDEKEDLTKIPPYEVSVAFVDSVAKVNWNTSLLDNFYSSYDVQKSADGITNWVTLNTKPLVNVSNGSETSLNFTDSLYVAPVPPSKLKTLNLETTYYYRVRGRTPFGEYGRESNVVSGKVRLFLHDAPYIAEASLDLKANDNKVNIKFSFPRAYNPAVNKFLISYSTTSSTTGYTYLPDLISPVDSGRYVFKPSSVPITQTTFFRVSAIPFYGDQMDSNPEMVEPIDTIPPGIPVITSVVELNRFVNNGDSLLVAQITWAIDTLVAPNIDIDGYRIYRAQHAYEEPSQITNLDNIDKNKFTYKDTISYYTTPKDFNNLTLPGTGSKSLNTKVFYRVKAIDKRENQGKLSAKKFLRKPDRVGLPPVVINDYNMGDDGIGISWSPYIGTDSFYVDFDFAKMHVFRAEILPTQIGTVVHDPATAGWMSLGEVFDPLDSSFFDIGVIKGRTYAYCVVTFDASNNKSYSKPFIIEYKPNSNLSTTETGITGFTSAKLATDKFVKLNWVHISVNVTEYVLLRSVSPLEPLSSFKILENTEKELFDLDIKPGSTYSYGIMANYSDGTHSILVKTNVTF
jgi:uncharacterized protein